MSSRKLDGEGAAALSGTSKDGWEGMPGAGDLKSNEQNHAVGNGK